MANPVAMILTSCMMLEWLGETRGDGSCIDAASAVRTSVERVLERGAKTPDLGGTDTTSDVGRAVAKELQAA